jgi:nitroreductase
MVPFTTEEHNLVLDQIIASRHTVRRFKDDMPPRPMIEKVLQAGLLAPYAQISVTREDFRRFVVIPRESEVTDRAASLIQRKAAAMYDEFEKKMTKDELLNGTGSRYIGVLKMAGQQGLPGLGKAPYYIVVAEQRGTPEAADRSIAHCLENMWLKATALGLGFQLLSITERMAEDKEFCELIGIPFGVYAMDGCLIGYPDSSPPLSKRPALGEITRWL